MKGYLTIIIFAVIIVTANIDRLFPHQDCRDFGDVLEEELNICPFSNIIDEDLGFCVPYPVLFIPDTSIPDSIIGCHRFCYNNMVRITIDCYVCRNDGISDADGGRARLAKAMNAEMIEDKDGLYLYGPVTTADNSGTEGYSHFTKCVAKDKIWMIYSLTYPDKYAKHMKRLFAMVKEWQPWNKVM